MDFHQIDIRRFLLDSIPSRFSHLSQEEFTGLVSYLLEMDGYVIRPAVRTGELSNYLQAEKEDTSMVIQAFRYNADRDVDEHEIKGAMEARTFYNSDQSWIVTTSSFTSDARALAAEEEIELWDWDALYDALCALFFEGKNHDEYSAGHPDLMAHEEQEATLKLKAKWQAEEGVTADWFNLGITITNPTEQNIYIHLELPALIDRNKNQVIADHWIDGYFTAGMIYAGASVRTNALFSVSKVGERPPGGRIVLTCHERKDVPVTYHLQARLQGEACYIVTYCYSRQSVEYRLMAQYRDEVLASTAFGRGLIRLYYFFSPHLVYWAERLPWMDSVLRYSVSCIILWCRKRLIKLPVT